MHKSSGEKIVRLFFALWPEEAERAALAAWCSPLHKLCGGRVMRSETLHNTLVFLGDVPQHRLEALTLAAREVAGEAFEVVFDEARYWGHNRIVYAAPTVIPPQMLQLVSNLESRLKAHRFRFDRREYKPHVTLLRNAQWRDSPLPEMKRVTWQARNFALVQSAPDKKGANYRVLGRFSL